MIKFENKIFNLNGNPLKDIFIFIIKNSTSLLTLFIFLK